MIENNRPEFLRVKMKCLHWQFCTESMYTDSGSHSILKQYKPNFTIPFSHTGMVRPAKIRQWHRLQNSYKSRMASESLVNMENTK
jgi:hypothetical protein